MIRIRRSHEGGTLMSGISALIRVQREFASPCFLPGEDAGRPSSPSQEVCPHQTPDLLAP